MNRPRKLWPWQAGLLVAIFVTHGAAFLALKTKVEVNERAKALGILNEFYDAGVWIRSELTRSPLEFGEARYSEFIPNQLMLRCATVRPLHVEFVVHEASKNVFIRRYALVKL